MELIKSAETGVETFNTGIKKIFPNFLSLAKMRTGLGHHVTVDFYNVADSSECASGILLNATGQMRFMMHLSNGRGTLADGTPVSVELLSWSHHLRNAGLKFRKINAKTPAEAMEKLVKWFDKNREIILSV